MHSTSIAVHKKTCLLYVGYGEAHIWGDYKCVELSIIALMPQPYYSSRFAVAKTLGMLKAEMKWWAAHKANESSCMMNVFTHTHTHTTAGGDLNIDVTGQDHACRKVVVSQKYLTF